MTTERNPWSSLTHLNHHHHHHRLSSAFHVTHRLDLSPQSNSSNSFSPMSTLSLFQAWDRLRGTNKYFTIFQFQKLCCLTLWPAFAVVRHPSQSEQLEYLENGFAFIEVWKRRKIPHLTDLFALSIMQCCIMQCQKSSSNFTRKE